MRIVGLLIESSRAYGRGLLHGIAKFVRMHNDWSIMYQERMLGDVVPPNRIWRRCDGIIARIDTTRQRNWLVKLDIPVVDLRGRWDIPQFPRIISDDQAVAELAAHHLLNRGSRHFAFCGFAGADFSQRRRNYFCAAIEAAGHTVYVYESPAAPRGKDTTANESNATADDRNLGRWLMRLPHGIGLMACNDVCGRRVLELCHVHNLRVPARIAVIGVDNDELLCDLADPPMSSIMLPTHRIGYQAAELLAEMMRGSKPPQQEILVPPSEVMKRRSTDATAVEDPYVASALAFIREKACTGINVEDVLDHLVNNKLLVSRSTLDRRFRAMLQFSPKDHILNIRLERVRQLLLDTADSIDTIAQQVGLTGASQLAAFFKHRTALTPSQFRENANAPRIIKPTVHDNKHPPHASRVD